MTYTLKMLFIKYKLVFREHNIKICCFEVKYLEKDKTNMLISLFKLKNLLIEDFSTLIIKNLYKYDYNNNLDDKRKMSINI